VTDRTVSVRLRAEVAGYVAGMRQAAVATKGVATDIAKFSAQNKQASQDIGRASQVGGAAQLGLAGAAVKTAADFDKAMSGVQAATHESASNMELLRKAAIQAGADTAFSAMEAADGMTSLAKAGVSTKDVLSGGLKGALDLAAAGQVSVGDAADTAATAMTQFNLKGAAVPHIADLLAAAAGKAQGSVGDMSAALKQSGLVASQMGLSIEDTTGTLSAFASAGLIGSDAGTSLRTMLLRLANPSKEAAKTMSDLGIAAYDAQGNFVGIESLAGQLQTAFQGQSQATKDAALATIFGSDAIRGANVLYTQGAAGIQKWNDKVNDQGYAAKTAAIQLDNLRGDIEKLSGSLQTALIGGGSGANGALRGITQGATGAVNAFSDLPTAVQGGATVLSAVGGTALLAAGAFGTMAPKVHETRKALDGMGKAGAAASRGIGWMGKAGGYGIAIAAVGTAVHFLADEITRLKGEDAPAVDKLTASLVKFSETGRISGAAMQGIGKDANKLVDDLAMIEGKSGAIGKAASATSFGLFGAYYDEAKGRVEALDQALTGLVESGNADAAAQMFASLATKVAAGGGSVQDFKNRLDDYSGALLGVDTQQKLAARTAVDLGDGLGAVTPEARAAAEALDNYKISLDDMTAIDAYTANAQLAQSFRELSKSIKTGGKVTNEEKISLGGFAREVKGAASAVFEASGNQDKANATMGRGRRRFIDLAEAAGYSASEAKTLADRLGLIKSPKPVTIKTPGLPAAINGLGFFLGFVNALDGRQVGVSVTTTYRDIGGKGRGAGVPVTSAGGGYISGPGTWTSDSIPALLSDGEYVVKAAAVAKYGRHFFDAANAMHFADGGDVTAKAKAAAKKADDARAANRAAASASATARAAVAISRRTPGTDTLADIEAAIAAVERLTAAYDEQQALVGMSAAERRKYHAEQKTAAVGDRLATRREAAQKRDEAKKELADNQAAWEFDHLTEDQQLAAIDKKLAGEKKFSAQWMADARTREQIVESIASKEKAAQEAAAAAAEKAAQEAAARLQSIRNDLNAAVQERDQLIASVSSVFASFGSVGQGINLGAGANEVIGSQVGATDVITGSLITGSQRARVLEARTFVANLRRLRELGMNPASVQEIFALGPSGGAAYAAALVADSSEIANVNANQADIASLGQAFGAEMAGPVRFAAFSPTQQPTTFNIFDANGVLMGTMYGAADQVANDIATLGWYGRNG
jgi:TP901 family phage tail tape measure protein